MVTSPSGKLARTVQTDEFEAELLTKLEKQLAMQLKRRRASNLVLAKVQVRQPTKKHRLGNAKLAKGVRKGGLKSRLSTPSALPHSKGRSAGKKPYLTAHGQLSYRVAGELSRPELAKAVHQVIDEMVRDGGRTIIEGLDPALKAILGPISSIVQDIQAKTSEENIRKLVEVMLPSHDPVAAVRASIDRDNAEARVRFVQTVPCYTNAELAEFVGHGAKNKSATGSRWKADGKVFSVTVKGTERYPAFQFGDGRPLPVIAKVLAALPENLSPWQIAFWFVSSNRWLNGKAPVDCLGDEGAAVRAAKAEGDAVVG
ncbi:hypothetical protein [Microvirga sp. Mcv34]|uniref:hypothetical protein n=1 Tax=Microvirga sp. Mcv34 TaxID=2926016 RepID=UPI0021C88B99|nr:hypothetical protein [Microvirga sp. Mcv34]